MERQSWDTTRIEMAKILAKRSRCSRDQVGAIIVDHGNKIIGEGYNGPPSGFKDPAYATGAAGWVSTPPYDSETCASWCTRAEAAKQGASLSLTYLDCPSLHAEANALITSDRSLRVGGTIYVTSDVCMGCAKLIANSGLARVYVSTRRYDKHRNPNASYEFLQQCGLLVNVKRPTMRGEDGGS